MKIAELETHHDACIDSERTIRLMVGNADFSAAFSVCIESFPHIVPAINFRKKRGISPEVPALLAFTTICKYAPPLFEHTAIESLSEFVRSNRILANHENDYMGRVEAARNREQVAYVLWNHIEKHSGLLQCEIGAELGAVQEDVGEVIELWDVLGVIDRQPTDGSFRLRLRLPLHSDVTGLCPSCGVHARGRKELFFRIVTCQRCGVQGYYHIQYVPRE
jgi:hypothetical protein